MIPRHHMTRYMDADGVWWVESWIQVNLLGRCWCLSRRRVRVGKRPPEGPPEVIAS